MTKADIIEGVYEKVGFLAPASGPGSSGAGA